MPEMPEVETVRRTLAPHVTGRAIAAVRLMLPRLLQRTDPDEFARVLTGRTITSVGRRAKYLRFALSGTDRELVVHLGMTGVLMYSATPPAALTHVRAVFELDRGALYFDDVRTFGKLYLLRYGHTVSPLGPEPLSDGFTAEYLQRILSTRTGKIKSVLLDQALIAGLGNIYADEALFAARIYPARPAKSLAADDISRLRDAVNEVIATGIADGGTTFSDYRDGDGHSGTHQEHLRVYQRTGAPCVVCGAPIARVVIGGRSSHYCPRCQT